MPSAEILQASATPSGSVYPTQGVFDRQEVARYFAASVMALALDAGTLAGLVEWGHLNYLLASCLAFLLGTVCAFVLSVGWVFKRRAFSRWSDGLLTFTWIGLMGLAINSLVLWVGVEKLAFHYLLAKILAAGSSFLFNFAVRKIFLFTRREFRT